MLFELQKIIKDKSLNTNVYQFGVLDNPLSPNSAVSERQSKHIPSTVAPNIPTGQTKKIGKFYLKKSESATAEGKQALPSDLECDFNLAEKQQILTKLSQLKMEAFTIRQLLR
jgi:hypothetical protein